MEGLGQSVPGFSSQILYKFLPAWQVLPPEFRAYRGHIPVPIPPLMGHSRTNTFPISLAALGKHNEIFLIWKTSFKKKGIDGAKMGLWRCCLGCAGFTAALGVQVRSFGLCWVYRQLWERR